MTQPPEHTDHSLYSSLREGMLEHLFVGGIMRKLWLLGVRDFDVLRPITDAAGYDIVLSAGGAIRHVQLKSSALTAKTPVRASTPRWQSNPRDVSFGYGSMLIRLLLAHLAGLAACRRKFCLIWAIGLVNIPRAMPRGLKQNESPSEC